MRRSDSNGSMAPGANGASGQPIVIRVSIPNQNLQKAFRASPDETVALFKAQIIEKLAKDLPAVLNFGVYIPGVDGKEGRFMDDMRLLSKYKLENNATVEFKPKYKHGLQYGSKQYQKENSTKIQKKLMDIVRDGKVDDLRNKIDKSVDPNFLNDDGMSPLVQAVLNNDRDSINALIENGAIIDYRTKWGCFTKNGPPSSPNAVNSFGGAWFTPIHVAAAENKLIALQTLMYYGGSLNVLDSAGMYPINYAAASGHNEIVKWILIWSAVHYKEDRLAIDLEQQDSRGKSILHHACQSANYWIIQLLVDYGSNVNCKDANGDSPLHAICARPLGGGNAKDVASILLAYGADRESKNNAGQTPYQTALMSGNVDMSDFVKKWPTDMEPSGPMEVGQLVENARKEWSNIKKMMTIGTNNVKLLNSLRRTASGNSMGSMNSLNVSADVLPMPAVGTVRGMGTVSGGNHATDSPTGKRPTIMGMFSAPANNAVKFLGPVPSGKPPALGLLIMPPPIQLASITFLHGDHKLTQAEINEYLETLEEEKQSLRSEFSKWQQASQAPAPQPVN
eukprot:Partr_v1_DN26715_c0_g1_i2_m8971 putative SH3 and multiple ankyrin repeat domains